MALSQLHPHIFNTERRHRTLVAACARDELHEIGTRSVADFFEMDGWDTCFLGANVPIEGVVKTALDRRPHLIALSATIISHVDGIAELIERLRSHESLREIPILVGGYPFKLDPTLWRSLGADGSATRADEAVALGNRLVEPGDP